jgi:hypothetical protein
LIVLSYHKKNYHAMLSEAKIISIFCIVDDMLKACGHKEDIRIRVSDSEIITTAIISALYFGATSTMLSVEETTNDSSGRKQHIWG